MQDLLQNKYSRYYYTGKHPLEKPLTEAVYDFRTL